MLVLCGPTYPDRLWCVWELFTLLSFSTLEHAQERITLAALTLDGKYKDGLDELVSFDVNHAHCYDPNEEARLRSIISASSEFTFNSRIQKLAEACRLAQQRLGFIDLGLGFGDPTALMRDIKNLLPSARNAKVETEMNELRQRVSQLEEQLSKSTVEYRAEREQRERDNHKLERLEARLEQLAGNQQVTDSEKMERLEARLEQLAGKQQTTFDAIVP